MKYAPRPVDQRLADKVLTDNRPMLASKAASAVLRAKLNDKVRSTFRQKPELSWDEAVAALPAGDAGSPV
jgi:hypothetical protein